MAQLFDEQTTDADSSVESFTGGNATVFVNGKFDGATVSLMATKYGETVLADPELSFTKPGIVTLSMAAADLFFRQEGSNDETSINAGIETF